MKIVTSSEIREIEANAIRGFGIPEFVLMENAAKTVARHCLRYLKNKSKRRAAVVAGPGNNGGDGAAAARYLYMNDADVSFIFLGDLSHYPEKENKNCLSTNLNILQKLPVRVIDAKCTGFLRAAEEILSGADLIVDAVFGTGLSRNVEGIFGDIIDLINKNKKFVVSVDIPSGINSDDAHVMGRAVRADKTVTFTYPKAGLVFYPGADFAGEIITEDIGITRLSRDFNTRAEVIAKKEAAQLIPKRPKNSNKGSFGKVFVIAGCDTMTGAALLCCRAAYKTGAGLVTACVTKKTANVIRKSLPEAVLNILPDENGSLCLKSYEALQQNLSEADVIIIGPGLRRSNGVVEFVKKVLTEADAPFVIDADALNAISDDTRVLNNLKKPSVITPHPGEMGRLMKLPVNEIVADPLKTAADFAESRGVVTVLKGARTVTAVKDMPAIINATGNPALAKAGTGDVLSGIIGAFVAQGCDAFNAAILGVYIHGAAGDIAAKKIGGHGVLAGDVCGFIPRAIKETGDI